MGDSEQQPGSQTRDLSLRTDEEKAQLAVSMRLRRLPLAVIARKLGVETVEEVKYLLSIARQADPVDVNEDARDLDLRTLDQLQKAILPYALGGTKRKRAEPGADVMYRTQRVKPDLKMARTVMEIIKMRMLLAGTKLPKEGDDEKEALAALLGVSKDQIPSNGKVTAISQTRTTAVTVDKRDMTQASENVIDVSALSSIDVEDEDQEHDPEDA